MCKPNYYEYCASLTEAYRLRTNDSEAYVSFNGTNCVGSKSKKNSSQGVNDED
jgi:hypothetical protein